MLHLDTNGKLLLLAWMCLIAHAIAKAQDFHAKKPRGIKPRGIECALLGLNNLWSNKEDQLRG